MKYILPLFAAMLIFSSCKKELSLEGYEPVFPQPPVVDTTEDAPRFRLTAFYSDIPIDFNESDENIALETNLWAYVQDYIKDDEYVLLEDGQVEIHQHAEKISGIDDAVLYRTYAFGTDELGEYMNYLSYQYEPVKYRLNERTDTYFVISLKWKAGSRVYSRFERIN